MYEVRSCRIKVQILKNKMYEVLNYEVMMQVSEVVNKIIKIISKDVSLKVENKKQ